MNELTDKQILAAITQEHYGRIALVNVNGKPSPTFVARTFVDRIIAQYEAQSQAEPKADLRPDPNAYPIPAQRQAGQEPVAWLVQCKSSGLFEQAEPMEKATNPEWTDAFPVYAAPQLVQVPLKTMPDPDWKGDVDEATYKAGWNDCCAAHTSR